MSDELRRLLADPRCLLCRVVAHEWPTVVVLDTPDVVAFATRLALNPGHTLVVPRRHVRNLYDLPDDLAGTILSAAARVARALRRALAADGITLRQHNEAAGGQEVFHFHLHVVPRFRGDDERMNAAPPDIGFAEQEAMAARLRSALTG